ncbi:MAG: hypothetical protein E7441_06310 [Ruminococcaceae bacterium]|nr:hypothetical protein [Oscillospiraceae bacterium]
MITKIIKFLYRCLLSFSSTSLILIIYYIDKIDRCNWFPNLSIIIQITIFLAIPVFTTVLGIVLGKLLPSDEIRLMTKSIELANNSYLPSYLGYFFVAVSVSKSATLWVIYGILFVFTFLSMQQYFNPILMLFGYKYYNITTADNIRILVITTKQLRCGDDGLFYCSLKRINDHTFIDFERN